MGITIQLLPLGSAPTELLDFLRKELASRFGAAVSLGTSMAIPDSTYHPKRRQYNSTAILRSLRQLELPPDGVVLAVTEEDLYADPLRFVFGEADPVFKRAIISLARLRTAYPGKPFSEALFRERALKEAVHELGHVFGLPHCRNPRCVMHFSNSLFDTDVKSADFCPSCKQKLKPKLDAAASSLLNDSTSSSSS
jgi:archaemetzincin